LFVVSSSASLGTNERVPENYSSRTAGSRFTRLLLNKHKSIQTNEQSKSKAKTKMKFGEHLKSNIAPEYGDSAYLDYSELDDVISRLAEIKPSRYARIMCVYIR